MNKLAPINKELELNNAQLRAVIHAPKVQIDIWSRATGKSTGKAWRMHKQVQTMPRSTGIITGTTFQQILTRTLPATFEALERLGYEKDVHYMIGKEPPRYWKRPHQQPLHYERFISFYTGAGFHLSSQDREGMARGYNVDSVDGDEMLTSDKIKFENEVLAANRGNDKKPWAINNPYHHGISLSSSMPTNQKSKWLLDFSKYYEEDGNNIWLIWNRLVRLQLQFIDSNNSQEKVELLKDIEAAYRMLKFYKSKEGVFFTVANVFDNIKNLGWNYIKQMRRQMSTLSFRVEILNEKLDTVEDCFYKLDDERHFYTDFNYPHLDNLEYDFTKFKSLDCRQDRDLLPHLQIDMVIDYGAVINAMWIGQEYNSKEYRFLKTFFVKYPEGLKEIVDSFDDYYKYHQSKDIILWYDHTAVGRDAVRASYVNETVKLLKAKGWSVTLQYIGQAPSHSNKYLLWDLILKGDDRFPKVLFNRINCKDGILSMQLAEVTQGKEGFAKDKRSEQRKSIPREQATDFSEAADIVMWGRYASRMNFEQRFIDVSILKA